MRPRRPCGEDRRRLPRRPRQASARRSTRLGAGRRREERRGCLREDRRPAWRRPRGGREAARKSRPRGGGKGPAAWRRTRGGREPGRLEGGGGREEGPAAWRRPRGLVDWREAGAWCESFTLDRFGLGRQGLKGCGFGL